MSFSVEIPVLDLLYPLPLESRSRVMAEVVLYSKPGCCLCEEMKRQLERLSRSHPFRLSEVNILEDRVAFEKFKEEIPVVFINGRKAFKYRLDEREFVRRITRNASARNEARSGEEPDFLRSETHEA